MPNFTPNYNFNLPLVNDPTDQDLWGGYLNANWSSIDTILNLRTQNYDFAYFQMLRGVFTGYAEKVQALGDSTGAVSVDLSLGNHITTRLIGSVTFSFTNAAPATNAMPLVFYLKQDNTGSRLVTWPASVKWPGDLAPLLTATPNKTDQIVLITLDNGTSYSGSVRGYNYNL